MAKISSFVQKIFGKDATNIGQVGSAAAGTKVLTTNPTTIQALTAFTNGISDVTLTKRRIIPQEELMALHYLHSMQNAYQQQEGIQEYNSGVTYFTNSIVKKAGTFELYGSLIDNNTGNALGSGSDTANWKYLGELSNLKFSQSLVSSGYQKLPSGLIVQWGGYTSNTSPSGLTCNFPITFPNSCLQIVCSDIGFSCVTYAAVPISTSQFTLWGKLSGSYYAGSCSAMFVGY